MPDEFILTGAPIRVVATTSQNLQDALEVDDWDDLDALLAVLAVEGAGSVTIELQTGMQKVTEFDDYANAERAAILVHELMHTLGADEYAAYKLTPSPLGPSDIGCESCG
jgi:hypothetical protein